MRIGVDHAEREFTFKFSNEIQLPKPSLQSIVSITYFDSDNSLQTLASSAYWTMQPETDYGYIKLKDSAPGTYDRPDAVTIEFTAYSSLKTFDILLKVVVSLMNEEKEGWKEMGGVKSLINSLRTGR